MHQNACPWAFCEDSAPFESREGLKEIREALGESRETPGERRASPRGAGREARGGRKGREGVKRSREAGLAVTRRARGERREAEGSLCSEHVLADVWDIAVTGSANLRRRQGFD